MSNSRVLKLNSGYYSKVATKDTCFPTFSKFLIEHVDYITIRNLATLVLRG